MSAKRKYTTGDADGAVVVVTRYTGRTIGREKMRVAEVGLLQQDDRRARGGSRKRDGKFAAAGGLSFSLKARGTVFDTRGQAENAARRYKRANPGCSYKVFPVGRREVDRSAR